MKLQDFLFRATFLLLVISGGCAFPGMSGEDVACPDLEVAFVGADQPMVCAGEAVTVRVRMADDSADVRFMITASDGNLSPVSDEHGVWTFMSDVTPGTTVFRVFRETDCGSAASTFDLLVAACGETDTVTDFHSGDSSDTESDSAVGTDDNTDESDSATSDTETESEPRPQPPEISYDGPRHVILFIGDGMGENCEIGLSRYIYGTDADLIFHDFPYANYVTTWDIDTYDQRAASVDANPYDPDGFDPTLGYDPIIGGDRMLRGDDASWDYLMFGGYAATDSGAAATALATGHKTDDGNIAWQAGDPEGGAYQTIAEDARSLGMKMGVVSTVGFSHATPAAFISHNTNRGNYQDIAREILFQTVPDVVIGAGHPGSSGSYSYLSEAEYQWLKLTETISFAEWMSGADGGETLMQAADNAASGSLPLFGLFGTQTFGEPFPANSPGDPGFDYSSSEEPTLPDATLAALKVLGNSEKGFFLMVEGGAIDKANHANDYSRMIGNMWGFERAIKAAMDWVNTDGDLVDMENTLIIVTADHANGYITHSETNPLGMGALPNDLPQMDSDSELFVDTDPGATYAATGHTNEMVRVYAAGAGIAGGPAACFAPYEHLFYPEYPIVDNTHIYKVMRHFLGADDATIDTSDAAEATGSAAETENVSSADDY